MRNGLNSQKMKYYKPNFFVDKMASATKFYLFKKFNISAAALELKLCA